MKKDEKIAELKSRIIKVTKEFPIETLATSGDKEYSFTCLVQALGGGLSERDYSIRVVDEGLPTELADYVNGNQPEIETREQQLKRYLKKLQELGEVKGNDLSNLGINFADLNIAGTRKLVAVLDGELIIIDGV